MKEDAVVTVSTFDINKVNCKDTDHMLWHQFDLHWFISWKKKKTTAAGCAITVAVWPSGSIC
jgi:hypothetical protein